MDEFDWIKYRTENKLYNIKDKKSAWIHYNNNNKINDYKSTYKSQLQQNPIKNNIDEKIYDIEIKLITSEEQEKILKTNYLKNKETYKETYKEPYKPPLNTNIDINAYNFIKTPIKEHLDHNLNYPNLEVSIKPLIKIPYDFDYNVYNTINKLNLKQKLNVSIIILNMDMNKT